MHENRNALLGKSIKVSNLFNQVTTETTHMQTDLTIRVRKPCSQAVLIGLQDFQPRFSELMIEETVFSVFGSVFRTLHRLISPSRTLANPPIPTPSPHLHYILTPGLALCVYTLELHVLRDVVALRFSS